MSTSFILSVGLLPLEKIKIILVFGYQLFVLLVSLQIVFEILIFVVFNSVVKSSKHGEVKIKTF